LVRSSARVTAASRLPQSRRLRPGNYFWPRLIPNPPHDCRSRGDCGFKNHIAALDAEIRLTIAAVAATAAVIVHGPVPVNVARLTIAAVAATAA